MREFIASLSHLQASAPTWCSGWSVHEVAAHVAAAAEERADLIDDHLAGKPLRPTRSWEVREPPFRAMPDALLRERLVEHAVRFESKVASLNDGDTVVYTGWGMTAERLRMHSHSEAVLHRWDLVGDDDIGIRLLSDPALADHALAVFDALPMLSEAERWRRHPVPASVMLRALELRPHELPLVLWGRCPARLRNPNANAENIDDVLRRLANA